MYSRLFFAFALTLMGFTPPARGAEARFDVAVSDSPARPFFEGLADGTPYNIVLEPGVGGTITLKLKNVTLIEVLDAVREAYGYDYRRIPSGFIIVPAAMQTRLFQVNYIDLERRGTSRTRVASGQVGQSSGAATPGGAAPGSDAQSQGLSEPAGAVFSGRNGGKDADRIKEITGTSISTRSSSDFWPELEVSLKGLVGTDGGRAVIVNAQSGIIAVRANPRELRDVQQFLDKIQDISSRQVIIEAKIVEVELSSAFRAGINWAAIAQQGSRTISGFQTGPQQGFGSNNLLNQPSVPVTVGPGNPVTSMLTNSLGGAFTLAVNAGSFNAYVELLATQGKTRVLSSPRVSTINNQKAIIKAGDDEYFVTGVSSNTVVGVGASTASNLDLAPFFSGVALDVTPQLSGDGQVILHIHPTVSDVTQKVLSVTVQGVTNSLPLAFSQVRESDSVVKAKSGQLIVIGGLMLSNHQVQNYSVPLLGDIPVVGKLFRSQQKTDDHTELVILLRPIIVDSDDQWTQLTGEAIDHANALDPTARKITP
ncbi:MAG TPA: pilus (MSHA type) biogenesis protein MshL [Steroidobacteraceae bacterium]|jgi:MSHA biogenesis protein MshL|nr:pilus (MSHA type) biogenesis protein MshL [Steroidobacteraceae bacterium]